MQEQSIWRVTGVSDTVMYQQGVGPQPAKRIDYVLQDGTTSYVIVPLTDFNRDKVAKTIHDAAMHMIDVLTLEGPTQFNQ